MMNRLKYFNNGHIAPRGGQITQSHIRMSHGISYHPIYGYGLAVGPITDDTMTEIGIKAEMERSGIHSYEDQVNYLDELRTRNMELTNPSRDNIPRAIIDSWYPPDFYGANEIPNDRTPFGIEADVAGRLLHQLRTNRDGPMRINITEDDDDDDIDLKMTRLYRKYNEFGEPIDLKPLQQLIDVNPSMVGQKLTPDEMYELKYRIEQNTPINIELPDNLVNYTEALEETGTSLNGHIAYGVSHARDKLNSNILSLWNAFKGRQMKPDELASGTFEGNGKGYETIIINPTH